MVVQIFLCVLVSVTTVSGLRSGIVENWIEKAFCTGSDVYVHIPWDCSGYLHCDVGYANWTNCDENTKFDANIKSCLFNSNTCQLPEVAAALYCPKYPHLKFAHPKNCAMYYDCGMVAASSQYGLLIFEDECSFPQLFDNYMMTCRADEDLNPVPCNNRPQQQCDYVKECRGAGAPTDCMGLPDGAHPDPRGVFLPNYIVCSGGNVVGRFSCDISLNKVFDPIARTCSPTYKFAIENYCKQNPTVRIADPISCSMYYDCSVENHHNVLDPYKTECSYLHLFDLPSKSCRRYNESGSCDTRFEPKAPCEYRVSDCTTGGSCLPCSADCVGLPDGLNPYPGFEGTRFHVWCDKERTLEIRSCTESQIFLPNVRDCGEEEQPQTTPPQATTDPTPTPPQTEPTSPPTTPTTPTEPPPQTDPTTLPPTDPTTPPPPPPLCDKPCGLDEHQDNFTSMFGDVDMLNELAAQRPEYLCATPPSIKNARTKVYSQSSTKVAGYSCEEDHDLCGRSPRSICVVQNQWKEPRSPGCVQNVWREFETDAPYHLLYECPPNDAFTVVVRGRHIEEALVLSISNGENQTEIGMLLYAKPDENLLAFGYETLNTATSPFQLLNNHEWQMHFKETKINLYLNGKHKGETNHNIDYSSTIALTVVRGFLPERVEFRKGVEEMVKTTDIDVNIALNQPVVTSSLNSGVRVVTDGNNVALFDSRSCWSAPKNELYLIIDLGKPFIVRTVVTTTPDCAGTTCGILKNVVIYVTQNNDETAFSDSEVCAVITSELPPSRVTKHPCKEDLVGRYVTLIGENNPHKMGVCEVEVYGAIFDRDLPMFDCPDPPRIPHATVSISYSSDRAIATYTCDATYVTCFDVNVIRCSDVRGWDKEPQQCIKGEARSVNTFEFCPLYLGSSLEIRFVPQMDTALYLLEAKGGIFAITMNLTAGEETVQIGPNGLSDSPFELDKEAHLKLIAMSGLLLVLVDGRIVAQIFIENKNLMKLISFETSQLVENIKFTHKVEDVRPEEAIITLPLVGAASSSVYRNTPGIAIDSNAATSYPTGPCWYSAQDDKEPWIQVEMEQMVYVTSVTVSLQNTCPGCGAINLALNKPTFGSTGRDASSLPENVVDGNPDTCFSTDETVSWWMVDLQDSYLIKQLKILGAGTTTNVKVAVYGVHPDSTENPPETICKLHGGEPREIVCDSPVSGRFVKLQASSLTMCQVEVFAVLSEALHDIVVRVYKDEANPHDEGRICKTHDGWVHGAETLQCTEDVYGRFVRVEAFNQKRSGELMTMCEMTVEGSNAELKSWSPFDCPKPPVLFNGEYSMSFNAFEAVATYKCNKGYRFCSGRRDVISCDGFGGWNRDPQGCVPVYENMMGAMNLPCGLQLGETLVAEIMPKSQGFAVLMLAGENVKLVLFNDQPHVLKIEREGVIRKEPLLLLDEVFRLEITLLSENIQVTFNGHQLSTPGGPAPHITTLVLENLVLGTVDVWTETDSNAVFRYKDNLVDPTTPVLAGSTGVGFAPERIVDGNAMFVKPYCWSSSSGKPAYVVVDLGTQYLIDGVRYATSKDCCDTTNHDINVNVYKDNPTTSDPELCVFHEKNIPANTLKTLPCIQRRAGRYLKIEGLKRSGDEILSLCELEVFGRVAVQDPPTVPGAIDPCPTWKGYISVESPRLCYQLSTPEEADSYNKAQDACALKGGHLIDLDTKAKHEYMLQYLNGLGAKANDPSVSYYMFYVGLKKMTDGVYKWTSGSSFVQTWYETTPDQECGVLHQEGLGDLYGYEPRRYICEIPMFRKLAKRTSSKK